ncbi:MAG: DUF2628 domain-containing protein [Gammaproteobacteria bacterium]|nr:DUF2628 domain-containing protein [Gammaproteobacteria bacterium]
MKCQRLFPAIAPEIAPATVPAPKAYPTISQDHSSPPPNLQIDHLAYYEAYIGDKQTKYYLTRFAIFDKQQVLSFNFNGLIFTPYWLVYRKLWWPFVCYQIVLAPWLAIFEVNDLPPQLQLILHTVFSLLPFVFGIFANNIYYFSCKKHIQKACAQFASPKEQLSYLHHKGGVASAEVQMFGYFLVFGLDVLRLVYFFPDLMSLSQV